MADIRDRHGDKIVADPNSGCWLWVGNNDGGFGYGKTSTRSRRLGTRTCRYAHRVSWETSNGPILGGLKVLHKCDTPPCVNPAHLFLGTQAENVRDSIGKGRHVNQAYNYRGEDHGMSKIDQATAQKIVNMLAAGVPKLETSRRLGVSYYIVCHIGYGKTWTHLTPEPL